MLNLTEIPVAEGTRKTYLQVLSRLDKWLRGQEVNDETLSGYLSYLFGRGKTAAYAKIAIAAARWRCASEDKDDPRGKRCRNAIANFRRQGIGRGFGQVDGLTFEDAEKMLDLAAGEKTAFGWRDAAVIAVMSDSLLRVSECAAIDVEHLDFKGNTLFIPKSKTDQEGKGAMGYLGPRTLEHIRVWMEKAKITEGPLFRAVNKTHRYAMKRRIDHGTIRRIIKARAKQAGIPGRISGHSFRVGSAQSLTVRGASLVELQHAGRWTSPNMPAHYSKKVAASQGAMARLGYATQ